LSPLSTKFPSTKNRDPHDEKGFSMQLSTQNNALRAFRKRVSLLGGLLGALGCLAALTGCGSGSSAANQSLVRSLNAYIPASGADGSLSIGTSSFSLTGGVNLGFGQFANGGAYTITPSGSLAASATGPSTPNAIQFQTTPSLTGSNTAYTLVAIGEAGQTGTLAPQLIISPNYTQNILTIPSGDVAIRVINVSVNSHAVGLYATNNGTPSAPLIAGVGSVAYGYSAAANPYIVVTQTALMNLAVVDVTSVHTALSLSTNSNLNSSTFVAGQAYTLYVYGQPGNGSQPFSATWIQDFPAP